MDKPPRHNNDQLGVKKIGKKIKKKTPLHLPSLSNDHTSKNRLGRSIVPQLKIRPAAAALTQINLLARPPPPLMMGHGDQVWSNTAAGSSPVSVSLRSSSAHQMQPSHQYQPHSPLMSLPSSARFSGGGGGILPTPASPQSSFGGSGPKKPSHGHDYQQPPPRFYGSASSVPILPSPRFDGPGILPTPPLKPTSFTSSSSVAQGGILGPGKFPRPPHASSALVFPPSPFGEHTN